MIYCRRRKKFNIFFLSSYNDVFVEGNNRSLGKEETLYMLISSWVTHCIVNRFIVEHQIVRDEGFKYAT